MFVDSHCHLDRVDLAAFEGQFFRLMDAMAEQGIANMLCVSIDLQAYPGMLTLVKDYPQIAISVGVHPNEQDGPEPTSEQLQHLARHPKNVAIGETGLDYFRSEGDLEWQRERFRCHIMAARACDKPLIIHTRDARKDTIQIMKESGAEQAGGVMHCFTEDWDMARQALDLGFYISFSGIVTFKNAADLRVIAQRVPVDRLLIETDAPYLTPAPHRGKPNHPGYVRHVAECIAELRNMPLEALAETTRRNYFALFDVAH